MMTPCLTKAAAQTGLLIELITFYNVSKISTYINSESKGLLLIFILFSGNYTENLFTVKLFYNLQY